MKVCLATVCFRGLARSEFDELLEWAPKAGYTYVELQHFVRPGTIESTKTEDILQKLNGKGLKIAAVYGPGLGGGSYEEVEASIKSTLTMLSIAEKLNCDRFVATGRRRAEGGLTNIVRVLQKVCQQAEDKGVKICLESHYGNQIQFASDYDAIFGEVLSPQLGITLDLGHLTASGVDVYKLIDKYSTKIFHIHVKDMVGTQSVALGKGETDIAGYVNRLNDVGYGGFLSVELEVADKENIGKYIVEGRKHLEKILRELTD